MTSAVRQSALLQPRCLRRGQAALLLSRRPRAGCIQASATPDSAAESSRKGRIVFLGTPDVAAIVLKELVHASQAPDAAFEVVAVVSQPGKPRGRGNKGVPLPTPVQAVAAELGLGDRVLAPASAKDEAFLAELTALAPDVCVTAAYGNMLPQRFLDIPRHGTLNIHPSLLPKYRGAAPVQRCVQAGDARGGVSVAFTGLACDAGPILAQQAVDIDPNVQAPKLLAQLFRLGVGLLVAALPDVLAGRGPQLARPQDPSAATHAPKLSKEEGLLDVAGTDAQSCHNQVRALAGWPGTRLLLLLKDDASGTSQELDVRVVRTAAPVAADAAAYASLALQHPGWEVGWAGDGSGDMLVPCGAGAGGVLGVLRVCVVQPPTKKAMAARDFRNGLRGKRLLVRGLGAAEGEPSAPTPATAAAHVS